jgi:hypothetical protein
MTGGVTSRLDGAGPLEAHCDDEFPIEERARVSLYALSLFRSGGGPSMPSQQLKKAVQVIFQLASCAGEFFRARLRFGSLMLGGLHGWPAAGRSTGALRTCSTAVMFPRIVPYRRGWL